MKSIERTYYKENDGNMEDDKTSVDLGLIEADFRVSFLRFRTSSIEVDKDGDKTRYDMFAIPLAELFGVEDFNEFSWRAAILGYKQAFGPFVDTARKKPCLYIMLESSPSE